MKAQFLTPLRVEHVSGKWWRLTSALSYYSALLDRVVTVPEKFVTDFASIPRVPIAYWLFGGRGNAPAVVHDAAYRWPIMDSRMQVDRVFNEALKAEGKWFTTRWPMTGACITVGWLAYKSIPGCLDIRRCRNTSPRCIDCHNYYPRWSNLIRQPSKRELEIISERD